MLSCILAGWVLGSLFTAVVALAFYGLGREAGLHEPREGPHDGAA